MSVLNSLKGTLSRLSIARKIGYGYCLAIGVGALGTVLGLFLGDYYQQQALLQLTTAYQQQDVINELANAAKTMQFHPQVLVRVLGEPISFDYEKSKFFDNFNQIQQQIEQLETFVQTYPNQATLNAQDIQELSQEYQTTIANYVTFIESLWAEINPSQLTAEQIPKAQQKIWNTLRSQEAIKASEKFERFSEDLVRLTAKSQLKQKVADAQFQAAEILRLKIIICSMILSTVSAAAFALLTSRAIAHPILNVTEVAEKVTQQADFSLRVPINSRDEVGSLSKSLNQLVEWIGHYTEELELARQTLEDRVEERTQELQQVLHNLKAAQAQLIQSEKLSSIGQMVAGIAHEINNPVSFIYGNVEYANTYIEDLLSLVALYQKEYPHPSLAIQKLEEEIEIDFVTEDLPQLFLSIKTGAERIQAIVLSLRNFSRLDEATCKEVDLHEGLDNTLLILNHRLKNKIKVIKHYGQIPLVECYPAPLNQVFMNILVNAIDALEELTGKAQFFPTEQAFEPQIIIHTEQFNANQIQVRIQDNGPGIPTEIQHKLFDPFFTTKAVGKGTGLGLSIAYQIIENHQGRIRVFSVLNQGTEFVITLPIYL